MALLSFGGNATEDTNIVELLRKDHEKVKMLFREFDAADSPDDKQHIVQQAISELEVHALAEEQIFYPAVRTDSRDAASSLDESFEEHHVMRFLMGELKDMSPDGARFDAKFTVLAENVKHHIKEEESELFARARTGHLDLSKLGKDLLAAKAAFQRTHKGPKKKTTSKGKRPRAGASPKRQMVRKPKKRTTA